MLQRAPQALERGSGHAPEEEEQPDLLASTPVAVALGRRIHGPILAVSGLSGSGVDRGIPEEPLNEAFCDQARRCPAQRSPRMTGLRFGQPAPGFSLPSSAGGQTSLADFKGKDVVLVFYCYDWGGI